MKGINNLQRVLKRPLFSLFVLFSITMSSFAQQQSRQEDKIYDVVDYLPYFVEIKGDVDHIMKHISKNLKYPKDAWDLEKQGVVVCEFVINKDGSFSDIHVKRGYSLYPSLDKEAVRVVETFPKWHPGRKDGKPVRTRYTLPIRFFMREVKQ